jgi:hypothetical protein
MLNKKLIRYKFLYLAGLISLLAFTGGSCDQQLKYITLTPGSPTISPPGEATAVRPGVVNVTASIGNISGSVPLTVTSATLQSISVTPSNPILPVGLSMQFIAKGTYSDGTIHDLTSLVSWSSSSTAVSTISLLGKTSPVGAGITTITASLGTLSGSTSLQLDNSITLGSLIVNPTTTLPVGLTEQFTAEGAFSDGKSYDLTSLVTWTSSSLSVATINTTGNAIGVVTAVAPGSTTISAAFNGSAPATAILTVNSMDLVSMAVSTVSSLTVPGGRSIQFSARGLFTDGSTLSTHDITSFVTWSALPSTVAYISNTGLVTALGPANAVSTITATAALPLFNTTTTGIATITISAATLQSITVTPSSPTLPVGTTQKFLAVANYSDGTNYDVSTLVSWSTGAATNPIATMFTGMVQKFQAMGTYNGGTVDISSLAAWSSSDTNVAYIYPSGYALAIGSGTTQITATHDGITATTSLGVSPEVALNSIIVTPANLTLSAGQSQQYLATGIYADGSVNNLTSFVTWSSSLPSVATVTSTGVATAVGSSGLAANISASLGSFTGSTNLTIQ